jgi:hypothetical protein
MAAFHASQTGIGPRSRSVRVARTVFSVIGLVALLTAPVAAVSLWLLLTDPSTAAEVMERGDVLPLVRALATVIGKALAAVLAYL